MQICASEQFWVKWIHRLLDLSFLSASLFDFN